MADFLDVARDNFALNKVADSKADFERVFQAIAALKVVHSNSRLNIENIETLFAACEMAKLFGRFPGKDDPGEIETILSSLRHLIVRTIEATQQFPFRTSSAGIRVLDPPRHYPEFVLKHLKTKCNPRHTVSIITFNYDIGLDFALITGGCPPWYGFDNEIRRDDHIPFFKLHGSISWGISSKDKEIVPLNIGAIYNKLNLDDLVRTVKSVSWPLSSYFGKDGLERDPVIVPPTWNKADSHRTVEKVWSAAAGELAEAENIFVVGYSLPETDSFFRHLYALGTVGSTMLRRLWVFNPDAHVMERFRELLGPAAEERFVFNPNGHSHFDRAIEHLAKTFPSA